jgi:hypothetical protein
MPLGVYGERLFVALQKVKSIWFPENTEELKEESLKPIRLEKVLIDKAESYLHMPM